MKRSKKMLVNRRAYESTLRRLRDAQERNRQLKHEMHQINVKRANAEITLGYLKVGFMKLKAFQTLR